MSKTTRSSQIDRIAARVFRLPKVGRWRKASVRIPMRDGVELGADLYTPDGESRGLLLSRGPYGRGIAMAMISARLFASQGYTVLFASSRGTGDSTGEFDPMRDEARDGEDLVAWMRNQPWFPGRFGTVGASYLGHTQWAMLSNPPAELAVSVITMGPHDFSRHHWGTGSFNFDVFGWSQQVAKPGRSTNPLRTLVSQASFAKKVAPIIQATPVLPTADEFFTAQGDEWMHERLARPDLTDPFWRPMQHADALERVTTPTLIIAGWQDIFLPQSLAQYRRLSERGVDAAITIGAWTHLDIFTAQRFIAPETLDWLDAHLAMGKSSARRSPVRVRVTGADEWVELPAWPPVGASRVVLYLHPGGELGDAEAAVGAHSSSFTFDPADPTPAVGGNQIAGGGFRDDSVYGDRPDVLVYDSRPMSEDLTILGTPRLTLAHTIDSSDADLFVRISDVDPAGKSRNVAELYQRVRGLDEPVELALFDTAHTFRAGHRVRLIIAGGCFPQFSRNPGTGENPLTVTTLYPVRHTVDHSDGASHLVLPIAPAVIK